jgi:hypothetical protein
VAQKIGVICKSCGERIQIDDEYIPGIRGAEIAASLYQPVAGRNLDFVNRAWQKTLICENPDCRQTHEYTAAICNFTMTRPLKMSHYLAVDEGRKRVLLIAAAISAARRLAHWDGRPSPCVRGLHCGRNHHR